MAKCNCAGVKKPHIKKAAVPKVTVKKATGKETPRSVRLSKIATKKANARAACCSG